MTPDTSPRSGNAAPENATPAAATPRLTREEINRMIRHLLADYADSLHPNDLDDYELLRVMALESLELRKEIAALTAELESARADKERLDWLSDNAKGYPILHLQTMQWLE